MYALALLRSEHCMVQIHTVILRRQYFMMRPSGRYRTARQWFEVGQLLIWGTERAVLSTSLCLLRRAVCVLVRRYTEGLIL
jgi:hypothetical protein